MNTQRLRPSILVYVFLAIVALVQLLPFWLAITTSLKPTTDLSSVLLPPAGDVAWQNYADAVSRGNILTAIGNTALVTVIATAGVCILGAMAAYPLARRRTRLNGLVAAGILSLIMIPPLSILVPLYTLLTEFGGINTYWAMIVVMIAQNLPLSIFLFTAFMRGIPESLDEAARLDGASSLQVFFRIVFPLLKPVTATVVILASVAIWNDFAMSNYIMTDPSMQMIAPAVAKYFAQQSGNTGLGAANALIGVIPVLVAYLFLQRYFMKGMVAGSEK